MRNNDFRELITELEKMSEYEEKMAKESKDPLVRSMKMGKSWAYAHAAEKIERVINGKN